MTSHIGRFLVSLSSFEYSSIVDDSTNHELEYLLYKMFQNLNAFIPNDI